MKGFMIKDFRLLMRQGRYFGMLLILACAMGVVGSKSYSSFITSYIALMTTMFSFSSFSYDEYDSGMAFLISLPSGRQDYVKGKYAFSILLIFGGWLVGSTMRMIFFLLRFSAAEYLEILPEEPIYLMLCLIYISLTFPAMIKYGAERGRNAAFIFLAVAALGIYLAARAKLQIAALTSLAWMLENDPGLVLPAFAAVCALALFLSFQISLRIMQKKEF